MTIKAYDRAKIDLGPTIEQPEPEDAISFQTETQTWGEEKGEKREVATPSETRFPDPILDLEPAYFDRCKTWLRERLGELKAEHQEKMDTFNRYEALYRSLPARLKVTMPFLGACDDTIPVIAMAVDPVQARLDVGIMKQKPVFTVNPLRKSLVPYKQALEDWIDFNQQHRWHLRQVVSPRFMELAKLGTMVLKTIYDREEAPIRTYSRGDKNGKFKIVSKKQLRFSGARVMGIPRRNIMWPSGFGTLQQCPIVAEIQNPTLNELRIAEASGKITNVDKIVKYESKVPNPNEQATDQVNRQSRQLAIGTYDVLQVWFDYDIDEDGYPEHLVADWHEESGEFLSLRYNWYFHQRKPYTVIPYSVVDGSLDGIGLCEMLEQFQIAMTRWHRMASDNAYLANTRLYIARKNSGIEQVPRIYAGRVFYVDDPAKDFKPFQAGDIYPSTMTERQNLFGMAEKRTGVSDYLTGRESPILGSRATATSTVALIQEGTKRVEETLENIRQGLSEVVENAFYIWAQYSTEDLEDLVFGKDDTASQIRAFFLQISAENINGALQVSLTATDAGENKQSRQQMQLAVINLMMGYFEKLLQGGSSALQALQAGQPQFAEMVSDVFTASNKMFKDLLNDYDIQNPEQYLPDLTKYIQPQAQPNGISGTPDVAGAAGGPGQLEGPSGLAGLLASIGGGAGAGAAGNGSRSGSPQLASLAG